MFKAFVLLTLATGLSSIAHAYPAGCQPHSEGAFVQNGADNRDRIFFSSMAVCTEQMAQLKAQPHSVICGCHNSAGMGSLISMWVGRYGINKDVSCFRARYDDKNGVSLIPVKVKNSRWPRFYTLRDVTAKTQPKPDESVAKACIQDEAEFFAALNAKDSTVEIVEANIPANASN